VGCAVLAVLGLPVVPARADIVSAHGTARGFLIEPTAELAKIGFAVDLAGSFEFWYSCRTTEEFSTGSFKLVSKNAAGTPIDTVDLNPTTIVCRANDDPNGSNAGDEYVAGVQSNRAGTLFQVVVDLVDQDTKTSLPNPPEVYLNSPWPGMFLGVGVDDPSCAPNLCEGFVANIDSLSAVVTPEVMDTDGDGVADGADKCAGSAEGAVNADGCSIAQLVPCPGPKDGGAWKNHGRYVSELAKIAQQFLDAGLITEDEKDAIVAAGAGSGCGK
jgi:hypothetical protein